MYRKLDRSQCRVWTPTENLSVTAIRSPDCPARTESLRRLRYLCRLTRRTCEIVDSAQLQYSDVNNTVELTVCCFWYITRRMNVRVPGRARNVLNDHHPIMNESCLSNYLYPAYYVRADVSCLETGVTCVVLTIYKFRFSPISEDALAYCSLLSSFLIAGLL
jgi:hypothetical protein